MLKLDDYNPAQQQAITTIDGPLAIVAGPGTGKTRTLTARIAYLCEKGIAPSEILALTFTKKSANEMQARMKEMQKGTQPKMATFHALCYELIGEKLQFIDEASRLAIIQRLKKSAGLEALTIREIALAISRAKNLPVGQELEPDILQLTYHYNQELARLGQYDFDDLLRMAQQKLTQSQSSQYKYILVDEFQDTNLLQYQLLHLLNTTNNVCAIGDPLQSIYGFRGANGEMFTQFAADFPQAHHINLTINYRSVPAITRVSNAIFPQAPQLTTHSTSVGSAQAVQVLNEYSEAEWIINRIETALGGTDFLRSHSVGQSDQHCQFKDFAVVYRTHHTAKTTQRLLAESGLPFQVAGEDSPYAQSEIRQITTMLHSLAGQEVSPPKGFSSAQWQALCTVLEPYVASPLHELCERITTLLAIPPSQTLRQFLAMLPRFEKAGLVALVAHLEAIAERDFYDPNADAITLLTIHASKGLEFRYVFLVGAEEGILPHQRGLREDMLDEERRLFYVATTRAKEQLDILYAKTRGGQQNNPSRFITELPVQILPHHTDPQMAAQMAKRHKRQQKRAQTSLF